jgi:ATP-binding cassette subfamily D (ALD) long-chain fatty acid import protein
MYAYKDLLELAGLTTRLYTLLSTLHNLPPLPSTENGDVIELVNVDIGIPPTNVTGAEDVDLEGHEWVQEPTQVLVKDLSLVVKEGEHLMITGSNGVGKTAVARVLAGLWAGQGSHSSVSRPSRSPTDVSNGKPQPAVIVVPQRAYMVTGSLLAQIIYPHSYSDFLESEKTERDLVNILEAVHLGYLPEREGGWETRKEWRDVLSGGEKQRVSLIIYPCWLVFNIGSRRWDWRGFSIIDLNSPFWTVSYCKSLSWIRHLRLPPCMNRMHKCCVQ